MRKAASQSNTKLTRAVVNSLIATGIVAVLIATFQIIYVWKTGQNVITDASATNMCNKDQRFIDLYGSVSGNTGTAINGSDYCTYNVTLVSYNMPVVKNQPGWTERQTTISSKTISIGPNEEKTFSVNYKPSVDCRVQIDLIRGGEESIITPPFYGPTNNFMDADYIEWDCTPSPTPTPTVAPTKTPAPTATPTVAPTATPVVTASPTPVVTPTGTPVPTATPVVSEPPTASQPPRTDLTDGRSDGLGCSVRDCSGNKPNTAVLAASTTLPSTGTVGEQVVSYTLAAGMTFLLGIVMFQYVKLEEKILN
jgi:hypothetical protein